MLIYTGQFSKIEHYRSHGLNCVSIARYDPQGFNGESLRILSPSPELLSAYHNGLSFGLFAKEFLNYLETIDLDLLVNQLNLLMENYSGVILLCYESPNQFCHRSIVAHFLNTHTNISCTEFL